VTFINVSFLIIELVIIEFIIIEFETEELSEILELFIVELSEISSRQL